MSRSIIASLVGVAAIAAMIGGCGSHNGSLVAKSYEVQQAAASPGPDAHHRWNQARGGSFLPGLPRGIAQSLDLSDDQKAQLKAIAAKFRAARSHDANPGKALRDALLAPTVDDAALRAALQSMIQARTAAQPARLEMLTAVRNVLTDAQRATIVGKLQSAPQPSPRPQAQRAHDGGQFAQKLAAKLNLNADQQAAFSALQAKLKAGRAAHQAGNGRQAMLAFWQSGDTSALKALGPAPDAFPVEELVKFAESLDLSQRQALFGHGGLGFAGLNGHDGHGRRGAAHQGRKGHGGQSAPHSDSRG